MRSVTLLLLPIISLFASCVTTHYGDEVNSAKKDFAVSCGRDFNIDDNVFVSVSCSIENLSHSWELFEVQKINVSTTAGKQAHVSTPEELSDFLTAFQYKRQMVNNNTDVLLSGLIVVGAVAALSGGKTVAPVGAATAVGAATYGAGRDIKHSYDKVQFGDLAASRGAVAYGPEHLMGQSFRIPGGMFVRKHLLLEIPDADQKAKEIEVCFKSPATECITVPVFRGDART